MLRALVSFSLIIGAAATTFLGIGDWGAASIGGFREKNVKGVAESMQRENADFVLNTGDNFYYCGIQNTSDPQITEDFTEVFETIRIPWVSSLGNHDYGFDPDSQTRLSERIPNWVMDSRYYHRIYEDIHVIVLDTNPCIKDYRGDDRSKWDPCGSLFPECSPVKAVCKFHQNILAQDCATQLSWFQKTLDSIPSGEWVVVVGHHRADQIDVEDFSKILTDPRIDLYINGHIHTLEHYELDGKKKFVTSGAGAMVGDFPFHNENKNLWTKRVTGYTLHTITGNILNTEFKDVDGNTIYQFSLEKV